MFAPARWLREALAVLALALLATGCGTPPPPLEETPAPTIRSPIGFMKGYTWGWNAGRGAYLGERPAFSMKEMASLGGNWVTIAYAAHLPKWNEPRLIFGKDDPGMPSDDEIRLAIKLARQNGLKVCLKPVVNLGLGAGAPPGAFRHSIMFTTDAGYDDRMAWAKWWDEYDKYLLHHAKLAQETGCELLCIGCEMTSMEPFEQCWRGLIQRVREVYRGPLVYNSLLNTAWDIRWWDAVDLLGLSAYSWHPDQPDSSVAAQMAYWRSWRNGFRALATKTGKPILFIEIGCRSARGASAMSGDFSHWEWPYDGDEQARFYEAALRTFWDEPWFAGYSWWDWNVWLYPKESAERNKEFVIYGKPAEELLREWYAKPRK